MSLKNYRGSIKMNDIDQEAVRELFFELLSGAVLDGKRYDECDDPWEHCRNIVRSWNVDAGRVR